MSSWVRPQYEEIQYAVDRLSKDGRKGAVNEAAKLLQVTRDTIWQYMGLSVHHMPRKIRPAEWVLLKRVSDAVVHNNTCLDMAVVNAKTVYMAIDEGIDICTSMAGGLADVIIAAGMVNEYDSLKCCANCKSRSDDENGCKKGRIVLAEEVCKEWEYDGRNYNDRDIKL